MALDLSSKPPAALSSPTVSVTSDLDTSYSDRPASAASDRSQERPGSGGVRPSHGLLPVFPDVSGLSPGDMRFSPGDSRPFKAYPFSEGLPVYPQMAGMYGGYPGLMQPCPPGGALPGMAGLMDGSLSLSSPITQYLQQRKRRSESRLSSSRRHSATSTTNGDRPPPSGDIKAEPTSPTSFSPAGTPSVMTSAAVTSVAASDEPPTKRLKAEMMEMMEPVDPSEPQDESYWERRRKNNEAAKRSRDSRRAKEEEIALRAAFLEQENLKLRAQVTILKNETAKLHYMLYNRL